MKKFWGVLKDTILFPFRPIVLLFLLLFTPMVIAFENRALVYRWFQELQHLIRKQVMWMIIVLLFLNLSGEEDILLVMAIAIPISIVILIDKHEGELK
ncbi:hypothetical protein ACFVS2_21265 [Brevibacillus sp. NPDC058079]|uniref:hypothetical protein n=1 Tax=Brevibacillus sp. NPDC058079 TaxID=3346330 RepID=UPI0036F019C0